MAKKRSKAASATPVLPARIRPMLAQSARPFDSADHLFEIKWDGTRCIAFSESGSLRLQNRRFIEMLQRYPELGCLDRLPPGTVIDGEIIVLEDGKPSFTKLQQREHLVDERRIEMMSRRMPATIMVFDLLYDRGKRLLEQPLIERRERLKAVIADVASPHVLVPDFVEEHGCMYFEQIEKHGLEGIMAKRVNGPYLEGKRSEDWLKIKVEQVGEFDIIGFVQRDGGEPFASALALGMPQGRRWMFKGKVGTGFTESQRQAFYERLVDDPELPNPPKEAPAEIQWRASGLKCRVRFFEKTVTGMLRGPVFDGLIESDS